MRFMLASLLLVGLVASAAADDAKKKDDKADAKAEEPPKCLIVKAGEKDVSPPVEVDYAAKFKAKTKVPMTAAVAKTLCGSESNKPAQEWIGANGVCDTAKSTWKYTVTFGVPGKEEKMEKTVICPKKKK